MEVIWDSERFDIDLPVESFTLGGFKRYLSSRTGVPTEHMKLFCNAGLMKDDNACLSAYRLDLEDSSEFQGPSNSYLKRSRLWDGTFFGLKKRQVPPMRIRLVGSTETRAFVSDRPDLISSYATDRQIGSQPPPKLEIINEPKIIHLIRDLIHKTLSENLPKIERYEDLVATEININESNSHGILETHNSQPIQTQWDPTEFACISELLLQVLLKLDGFEIDSEWTEARMARKEGVRAVQKLLDRLDHLKGTNRQP